MCNSELHSRCLQHTSTRPVSDRHRPCIRRPLVLPTVQCDTRQTATPVFWLWAPYVACSSLSLQEEMDTDARFTSCLQSNRVKRHTCPPRPSENHADFQASSRAVQFCIRNKLLHLSSQHALPPDMTF